MSNSDYKLILTKGNDGKAQIRYRLTNDNTWQTMYLDESDLDKVITNLIKDYNNDKRTT